MGEWRAYEKHYGPLLLHDRIDFGFAALRTVMGGGEFKDNLPPWYDGFGGDPDDQMLGFLNELVDRWKDGEPK